MHTPLPGTLRRLRQERGLSLKKVASRLGVHFTTVSSWERGRSAPAYEILGRLARFYAVPVVELLGPGGPDEPRRIFRPLSGRAAEAVVRTLEELRLAVCLAVEIERQGGADELAERTGIAATRLAALSSGEATLRPTEIAALVRHLGSVAEAASLREAAGTTSPEALTLALRDRIDGYLDEIRNYLSGRPDRSHQ